MPAMDIGEYDVEPDPNELRPCPFCGGKATREDLDDGGSFVECERCNASSAIHYDRKENLVASWNRRT